jgi:hypothetical protein
MPRPLLRRCPSQHKTWPRGHFSWRISLTYRGSSESISSCARWSAINGICTATPLSSFNAESRHEPASHPARLTVPLTLWGSSSLAGCEAGSCRDSALNDERGVAVQIPLIASWSRIPLARSAHSESYFYCARWSAINGICTATLPNQFLL